MVSTNDLLSTESLQALDDDCSLLKSLLQDCLNRDVGAALAHKLERLNALSVASCSLRHNSGPEEADFLFERMREEIEDLPLDEAIPLIRCVAARAAKYRAGGRRPPRPDAAPRRARRACRPCAAGRTD